MNKPSSFNSYSSNLNNYSNNLNNNLNNNLSNNLSSNPGVGLANGSNNNLNSNLNNNLNNNLSGGLSNSLKNNQSKNSSSNPANNSSLMEREFYLFKSISLVDKFNFYEYLSTMLDGGITITNALESVSSKIKNQYFKDKIKELHLFISSGDSLNKAMKKLPDIFSQSECSIVEAGERSGTLVKALSSIASEFKKLHELKQTIKSSLTYPMIIFLFLFAAVLIVMVYVIPLIIPLIEESGVEKPFATKALIATSDFVSNNILLIMFFILLLFVLFRLFKASDGGKRFIDKLLLKLPLIGDVYRNYIIASSSSILGTLMSAGIPVIRALVLVGKASNNTVYEDLFNDVSVRVGSGKKIVDSMIEVDKDNFYFPADFLQLLSVGEKTASIGAICEKLNNEYTREVNYSLSNLTKWIEPIAILITGIFVLWFAFAIFGAILKLTQTVG